MKRVMKKEIVLIGLGYVLGLALYVDSANADVQIGDNTSNTATASNTNTNTAASFSGTTTTTGGMSVNTVNPSNVARPIDRQATWDEAYDKGVEQRAAAKAQAFKEKFCTENPDRCIVEVK